MTYPFVAAKYFSRGALAECRALVVHFAEGGSTVHYFQNPTRGNPPQPVDVSAHFVIEYSGRIVQMVRDGDADHCQHLSYGSWSYAGGLGPQVGKSVLGTDLWDQSDATRVNRYVQAIELEGFRSKGPNDAQIASLKALIAERRAKYGPQLRGLLGHGDIQNKACPGALIPWHELGGHGVWITTTTPDAPEVPMNTFLIAPDARAGRITVKGAGHYYLRLRDATRHGPIDPASPAWQGRAAFGPVTLTPDIDGKATTGVRAEAYIIGTEAAAILASDVTFTPDATADGIVAEVRSIVAEADAKIAALAG